MILLSRIFMLNALFTFEFLVLICSLFFLIYIIRHKLNKWFRYIALSISIVIGLLIICTAVNAFISSCHKHDSVKCSVHSSCEMKSAKCSDHHHAKCGQKHHYDKEKCEKEYSKKHAKKDCPHKKTEKESETNAEEPQSR